jgi:flagellar export protein FliJ
MTAPLRKTLPLNSIVNLRLAERDRYRSNLADSQQQLAASENNLQRIMQLLAGVDEQTDRCHGSDIVSITQFAQIHRYRTYLRQNQQAVACRCEQLAAELNTQRQQLIEAEREVQTLEKLRNKRLAEQQRQQAQQEVRVSDEVAGQRAHRDRPAA